MADNSADEIPAGFEVVSEWSSHWLLSRLMGGSGFDGDPAYFWIEQGDISSADLGRIVFQERIPGGDWTECPSAEGDFFPSRGYVQAVAGAYRHIFQQRPDGFEIRALVPHDLMEEPS